MSAHKLLKTFDFVKNEDCAELTDVHRYVHECDWVKCFKNSSFHSVALGNASTVDREELLSVAVAALLAFVQDNFVGPQLSPESTINLPAELNVIDLVKTDGEDLNVNASSPALLYICKVVFDRLIEDSADNVNFEERLWYLRYLLIHQRCLDDLTHSLYSKFDRNVECLVTSFEGVDDWNIKLQAHIEIAQGYILFKRITKSEQWMNTLQQFSRIELTIEGVLGVRTQYQRNPLPQLTLRTKGLDALQLAMSAETHGIINLPPVLKLEDDLRLEKVKYMTDEENKDVQLPSLVQTIVLTNLLYLKHSQPKDKLADEELQPYITALLYQEYGPWATRIVALFINICQEANHKRTVDRSLKQCEELVHLLSSDLIPVRHRLSYAFCSAMIPRWKIKAKLGDLMISLGMIKTALDLFIELHLWEEVIACYNLMDLRHKAAEIIRQEINKNPTVLLYCLLGDATDDTTCYRIAWELSKETSARAQRHWGDFHFAKKEYHEAIPHLQKSIEINCLQETTLLRLGFAALQLEEWEVAAKSYRLYTSLESHGFESWNNLAKAYIKLGDKKRAHKILQEALKCNFNNWMVWENFLIVSIDTKNYEDAINAYERLEELKDKFYDIEVLEILTKVISEGALDASDNPSHRLTKKMLKLLGHACAKNAGNGYLYELSARLESEDMLRKANKLQNAYRVYTQANSQWAKGPDSCEKILKLCIQLCNISLQAFLNAKNDVEKYQAVKSQLSSARLTGQGCLRAATNENWEQNKDLVDQLRDNVQKLTAEFTTIVNQ